MMCFEKGRAVAMAFLIGATTASCSKFTSPTQPTVTITAAPLSSPAPTTFTLKGRVTETPPTPNTGVSGARIAISVGPNAGQSATADFYGYYSIPNVDAGSTINVSADGYLSSLRSVDADADATFQLMPVPRTETHTMEGRLGPEVGTCSDGAAQKPCHIMTIPIHNTGPIDATLTWDASDGARLDLTLFQSGISGPIARSASSGSAPDRISMNLSAGSRYELHVTYASGTSPTNYLLKVIHQN